MCIETNVLLHIPLNNTSFYVFVFGATLAQYNLHYLVKNRAVADSVRFAWSSEHRVTHIILLIIGSLMVLIGILSFHITHFFALGCMSMISLLYSLPFLPFKKRKRIKDFGLFKIITLALLWTLVTVWFPMVEMKYTIFSFQLIFIRRFIFIFILCLMFDVRDIEVDGSADIKTLPVLIGIKRSFQLCYLLLILIIFISLLQFYFYRDMAEFLAMSISCLTTIGLVYWGKNAKSDYYYLAGIDGMMLLQAILVISGEYYLS